jgi:poly-beta-1,6 N-acetyl-D-glucosamine synthase
VSARSRVGRPLTEHWWTLGILVTVLGATLLLQGYARSELGGSSTASADHSEPVAAMESAGPVLDLSAATVRSVAPQPKTIALTFDDGPDPRWTARILEVLERHHVPATFFVVGSRAAEHPSMLRRALAGGDEIGNHTFTHADLSHISAWRMRLELRLGEVAIAAATGRHSILVRPPYSSVAAAAATGTLRSWQRVAKQGYLVVLTTLDSEDWRHGTTVDEILRRATPDGADGAIILMHDGGGDRAHTVDALDRLIPALQARGDRFVTIGDLARLDRNAVMPPASTLERWQSKALPVTLRIGERIADGFTTLAIVVMALAFARLVMVLVFARRHRRRLVDLDPGYVPTVSVLVPAYNEELGIAATVCSLADPDYPMLEIIVIDDGSSDETAAVVERLRDELPGLIVVTQPNAGKANALNAGLREAAGEIIVTVDADTVFEPGALRTLVQQFRDPAVGAVSGNTKVANRDRLLGRWQHLEYVMGFNLDRRMYDVVGCMPTVPGAIGAFRRAALDRVNGFSDDTLAEDTDLTMALHRAGFRVLYEPRAVAWTEAPHGLRDLWRQRYRWSYGTIQSVWKHRRAVIEGGPSRRLGRIGLPYVALFQIGLPLLGPIVDLFAVYGLLFLDKKIIVAYWLGFTAIQIVVTLYALRLDGERAQGIWTLPLQQVVYRQLMYLVVIQSIATALTGARTGWHQLRRTGAATAPVRAGPPVA